MSQDPVEGSEPPSPQPVATVVDSAPTATTSVPEQRPAGVTVPVAVPVTVALVLGLAIGLILGWLLPRPGGEASAGPGGGDTAAAAEEDSGVTDGAAAAEEAGATVLEPATPTPVPGGPAGTEQVAGLLVGEQGPLVEVFEDYVCPFCARLELSAGADLREAARSGEYRLVVHPIAFLTEDSPRASNASACVYEHEDLDVWVAFHEGVYQRQDPTEAVGQFSTDVLLELADSVGAGSEAAACITDETFVPWVEQLTAQAFSRGVRGTPTLTVDGTVTDVAPLLQ